MSRCRSDGEIRGKIFTGIAMNPDLPVSMRSPNSLPPPTHTPNMHLCIPMAKTICGKDMASMLWARWGDEGRDDRWWRNEGC